MVNYESAEQVLTARKAVQVVSLLEGLSVLHALHILHFAESMLKSASVVDTRTEDFAYIRNQLSAEDVETPDADTMSETDDKDSIALRCKSVRDAMQASQRKFAERLGCSLRAWQDYEAGKSTPGGQILRSLAMEGVDVNWLLTGRGRMHLDAK